MIFILLIITCKSIFIKDELYFIISPDLDDDVIIEHVNSIYIEKTIINLTILESQVSLINLSNETIIINLKTIDNSTLNSIDKDIAIISTFI